MDDGEGYLSLISDGDELVTEREYLEELHALGLLDDGADRRHPMDEERARAIPDVFTGDNGDAVQYRVSMIFIKRIGRAEIARMCSIPLNTLNKIIDGARPVTVRTFAKLVEGLASAIWPEGGTYLDGLYTDEGAARAFFKFQDGGGGAPGRYASFRAYERGPETYRGYLEGKGRVYPESMGERREKAAALLLGYDPDVERRDPAEEAIEADLRAERQKTRLLMLCANLLDGIDRDALLSSALALLHAGGVHPASRWRNGDGETVRLSEYRERFERVEEAFARGRYPNREPSDGGAPELAEDDLDWLIRNAPAERMFD